MYRYAALIVAGWLALVAPTAWASSPHYPGAGLASVPPGTAWFARLHHPLAPYPRPAYRPTSALYHPFARPTAAWPVQPGRPVTRSAAQPAATATPTAVSTTAQTVVDAKPSPADAEREASSPRDHQAAFIERLQPLVEQENARLLELRERVTRLVARLNNGGKLRKAQRAQLTELARRYRVDDDPLNSAGARQELLNRIDVVPVSLALAQAANESAWGKSRFAREANNLFGIWTYDETRGIVPRRREPGKKHLVRKFDNVADSLRYYMLTLNSHPAYAELRAIRADLRDKGQPLDGHKLADGLSRYSAKGDEYVRIIRAMIRRFDLAAFDGAADRKA